MADLTLLYTPASPFARKVRMVALLRGVELSLEETRVHPADRNSTLGDRNPLAKIPVLLAPEGPLYDSRVICRYLDAKGTGAGLYPVYDPWPCLRVEAMADGIMDAAVLLRYELVNRPNSLVWDAWVTAQAQRIEATLDWLEVRSADLDRLDVGTVGLAAALAYLDFRHGNIDWWQRRPTLRRWLDARSEADAMKRTPYPVS
jgi:glutathione S-transferase